MERGSSINIQPMKYDSWEHNHRQYTPNYVIDNADKNEYLSFIKDDFLVEKNNEYGNYKKVDFDLIKTKMEEKYQKSTGQKQQKNKVWFKEAVINTNEKTTIEDLKNISKMLKKEFNIDSIYGAHHKDEGYIENGVKKINWHYHLVMLNCDIKTGKGLRLTPTDLKKMQTLVAEILNMPMGIPGKNIRMEHQQYKKYIKELNEAKRNINKLERDNKYNKMYVDALKQENKEMNTKIEQLVNKNEELEKLSDEYLRTINTISKREELSNSKNNELLALFNALGLDEVSFTNKSTKEVAKEAEKLLKEKYDKERELLKHSGQATQQDYQILKVRNNENKQKIMEITKKNKDILPTL